MVGAHWFERFGVFIVVVVISVAAPLISFAISDDSWLRASVVLISLTALYFSFRISHDYSITDNKVRLSVVVASTTVLLAYFEFRPLVLSFISARGLNISSTQINGVGLDVVLLVFANVLISYFVLRSLRADTVMGVPQTVLIDVLPAITNLQRVDILKHAFLRHLDRLDDETRWSDSNYVPLDAEVQIIEGKPSRRRIVDLQTALRHDKITRMFIVLGEPGTGKSVAMRKLARDLLTSSGRRDRIPIYVNLKEWRPDRIWSADAPPTVDDFASFIITNILNDHNLDTNSKAFIQEHYRRLFEAGYLFFILDSFDEIPAVLDHNENSWMIKTVSQCIVDYVLSGLGSRAVIASRLFRKPRIISRQRAVFEIRPLSDHKIMQSIHNGANEPTNLLKAVFLSRPDLWSIARNPFFLQLIIAHANLAKTVPRSQSEMFRTFLQDSIDQARRTNDLKDLSDQDIFGACELISLTMFNSSNVGLEISEAELGESLAGINLKGVISFLRQARIGRVTNAGAFSFSHRRLNEYFLVRKLASGEVRVPYAAIPSDSRWRDALVLFAEVAEPLDARRLIDHAWKHVRKLRGISLGANRSLFVAGRHSLRFLVEGFRGRQTLIRHIQKPLASIVRSKLDEDVDYIEKRTVVEALGILPERLSHWLIIRVLWGFPGWISEQAVAAARYLPLIDESLADEIYGHCIQRPGFEGWTAAGRYAEVFSLSDAFRQVTMKLRWYRIAVEIAVCSLVVLTVYLITTDLRQATLFLLGSLLGVMLTSTLYRVLPIGNRWIYISYADIPFYTLIVYLYLPFVLKHVQEKSGTVFHFGDLGEEGDWVVAGLCMVGIVARFVNVFTLFDRSQRVTEWRSWQLNGLLAKAKNAVIVAIGLLGTMVVMGAAVGALVGLVFGLSYLFAFLPNWISRYAAVVIETAAIWLPAGVCFGLLLVLSNYLACVVRDRRRMGRFGAHFNPSRREIAERYTQFETALGRAWYVELLERVSFDFVDDLRSGSNVWPAGRRPQIDGDTASMKLAELDARWLDLD